MASCYYPDLAYFINELESLGVEISTEPAFGFQEYVVLDAVNVKRWILVPTQTRTTISSSLNMLTPLSKKSRFLKKMALAANKIGLNPFFSKRKLYIKYSPKFKELADFSTAAFFSGTPGRDRKITIQFHDKSGRSIFYGKVSVSSNSAELIAKEYKTLREISLLQLSSARVPRIVSFNRFIDKVILVSGDDGGDNFRTCRSLSREALNFLREMELKTKNNFSKEIYSRLNEFSQILKPTEADGYLYISINYLLKNRALDGVPYCKAHGDFTPWNFLASPENLYVFDWELSRIEPIGYDHIHFAFSTARDQFYNKLEIHLIDFSHIWFDGNLDNCRSVFMYYFISRIANNEDDEISRIILRKLCLMISSQNGN